MMVGCSSTTTTTTEEPVESEEPVSETVETTGSLKMGFGSVTSISASDATEDKDGSYEADTTYVFVGLDADDKIAYINYDVAQNSGKYNTEGVVTACDVAPTKKEKGDAYGMKSASGIGLVWFEQCSKFE